MNEQKNRMLKGRKSRACERCFEGTSVCLPLAPLVACHYLRGAARRPALRAARDRSCVRLLEA